MLNRTILPSKMKTFLFSFLTILIIPTFFAHASDDTPDRSKGTPSRKSFHYEKTTERDKLKLRKREVDWNRPGSKRIEDREDAPDAPTDTGSVVQPHDQVGPTLDHTDDQLVLVVKAQRRGLRGWLADQWQNHPKRLIAGGITGVVFLAWCFSRFYRAFIATPMTPEEQQAAHHQDQTVISTMTDMASRASSWLSDAFSDPMINKEKFQQN
jgi:hypothetical protein